jgi:dihydrofolate reductase
MRKLNVAEFISLDGVIQDPREPEGGTNDGPPAWIASHADAVSSAAVRKGMNTPFDLLLGRRTFELWAQFWPQHGDMWPARQHRDQVRRLEYHDFPRMAAVRVSKRRYCGKNRQNQTTGRAGFARCRKRKSGSDAPQA